MLRSTPSTRVTAILERSDETGDVITRGLRGEILRRVVGMGLPSMASFLLLTVYDLIDIFWLAQLGPGPVAAVTVFSAYLWFLTFPNQVVGTGSIAFISRRFVAGDVARTERAIKSTFAGKFVIGVLMGTLGWWLAPWALRFLGAEPDVVALGIEYGAVQLAVLGFTLVSFSVYTAFRCIGRPQYGGRARVIREIQLTILIDTNERERVVHDR